jgi:hypothetical protein
VTGANLKKIYIKKISGSRESQAGLQEAKPKGMLCFVFHLNIFFPSMRTQSKCCSLSS